MSTLIIVVLLVALIYGAFVLLDKMLDGTVEFGGELIARNLRGPENEERRKQVRIAGYVICALGVILLIVAAGFPPGITTTYEYAADGTMTESSDPGWFELIVYAVICAVGAMLARAAEKSEQP